MPESISTKALVATYNFALNDPPIRQTAESLAAWGCDVALLQSPPLGVYESVAPGGIQCFSYWVPDLGWRYSSLVRWLSFRFRLRSLVHRLDPDLLVLFMHPALAALRGVEKKFKVAACIYDIPCRQPSGFLDRWIIKRGWMGLKRADIIWSSDVLKAELTRKFANLPEEPIVCHNCPPKNYFVDPVWPRDGGLKRQLIEEGARLDMAGSNILLRAGAIGRFCGIEATLSIMRTLPENYIFLMMGRPQKEYLEYLQKLIQTLGLQRRAFIWDRPSDEVWKMALKGADLAHLIHDPPLDGPQNIAFALNSSLSNNRLFQYMAAGLPILAYDDPRMESLYLEVDCFRSVRLTHLAEDLRKYWFELGENMARRKEMGEAARYAHIKKYCWESQFEPIREALEITLR